MPLTADFNSPRAEGDLREGVLAASQTVFAGAILMRNTTTGHIHRGAVATGAVGVGRAEARATSGGSAGVVPVQFRPGVYRFRNSTAGDLIVTADIGKVCYIADDDRVAKTHATNTRSPAGVVEMVDDAGVWVRFDQALTSAVLS